MSAAAHARSPSSRLVLFAASTGCAMTVLDTNVVGIVLPAMARDLGARFADVEWVVSSYVLCFASLLLPAGAIADRLGRRRVFLGGIGLFGVASLLCGMAGSVPALCASRALQGVGAALLLAPALAIIGHAFHEEGERDRAWAVWGGIMGLTMALAPVVGGVIAHLLGWRWAFYVNVPICALLGQAVYLVIDESRDPDAGAPDPAGIALFAIAMFGLTTGLISGQDRGWTSVPALSGFGVGICGAVSFVMVERLQRRPMLDVGLFRLPRFVGAALAMFSYASCAQVMASLLPQLLQNGLGRTSLGAGFAMLPFALMMLVFPYVGRRLGRRVASHRVLCVGLLTVAAGNALTSLGAHLGAAPLVALGMLTLGAGGGLLNGETQKGIMGAVPRERAGMASGISTTARFSGVLLGFALLSGVLSTATHASLARTLPGSTGGLADAVAAGDVRSVLDGWTTAAREVALGQARQAYCDGFSAALAVAAVAAIAAAFAVGLLMREHGVVEVRRRG